MAKTRSKRLLGSGFSLGGEQAEADQFLQDAFYESGHYAAISSQTDPRCFMIGRTGSGKSAALQRLEEERPGHVIRINPEDLSLPYITELGAVRYLAAIDVHLDPLFIALWKHVLLIEIIKHRYSIDSPGAKQNFLTNLRARITRDRSKQAALDYLEEFEGRFWAETDERVRNITDKFEEQIKAAGGGALKGPGVSIGGELGTTSTYSAEVRAEEVQRFQRVVNETQLPRLNQMLRVLDDDILSSDQDFRYVVIDDLDRDWVDEKIANDLIRCLFRTVIDLKRVQNLKVLVALRTNIFEQLNFGSRTGGQEEKFRSLALRMRWTRPELQELLDQRARIAGEHYGVGDLASVDALLPRANKARGNALDYILNRTLMRPRDAIAFLNECLILGSDKARLTWRDIAAAERTYSNKRFLALRDEWKPSYPDIDKVMRVFLRANSPMTKAELTEGLEEIVLLPASPGFTGVRWLTELTEPVWSGIGYHDWVEIYRPLIRLLFNIGLIGCAATVRDKPTYAYDEPDFADRPSNIDSSEYFAIHPAFTAALDIRPDLATPPLAQVRGDQP